ncbi:Gag-Pol polyprotein [Phytophthora citrophthora]|uniref:Gag-Pol polyprotein n=1 Tax=Phytophthora citrophthora TaxID=4793 RepID=A0AAD9GXV2_9STRA|nr:Gag-Pol polyprotein [Phytophthora citrophthora]
MDLRGGGAYSAVVWKLPEWMVIAASSAYATQMTVNEPAYHGLILCLDLLADLGRGRLVICGDSNLVIRQMRVEIPCKAPALQLLREKAMGKLSLTTSSGGNQSADRHASEALQADAGTVVTSTEVFEDLTALNRLGEIRKSKNEDSVVHVPAIEHIAQAQGEEKWIANLRTYLTGDVADLAAKDARTSNEDRDAIAKPVIPDRLHQDFLHHYHAKWEGGRQGIGRRYAKFEQYFHQTGLFRNVQRYGGDYVGCGTDQGRPSIQGRSPGNLRATYSFQIIAIVTGLHPWITSSLLKSYKRNTELLIWADLFTGYVLVKASGARTAQQVAKSYEESVFRRFGASEVIRHDREPGFISDVFRAFNRIAGQRQSPTMAYRP